MSITKLATGIKNFLFYLIAFFYAQASLIMLPNLVENDFVEFFVTVTVVPWILFLMYPIFWVVAVAILITLWWRSKRYPSKDNTKRFWIFAVASGYYIAPILSLIITVFR